MITKSEADKKCMDLFGMNSDDYAKRILKAWKERTDIDNSFKIDSFNDQIMMQ
jgi:hypothetical protein